LSINGVGITVNHCIIVYNSENRETYVHPNSEDPLKNIIKINGDLLINNPVRLNHGDRLLIGNYHYYIYIDPLINPALIIDWEYAMKEANKE
jgi:hypothetical protein